MEPSSSWKHPPIQGGFGRISWGSIRRGMRRSRHSRPRRCWKADRRWKSRPPSSAGLLARGGPPARSSFVGSPPYWSTSRTTRKAPARWPRRSERSSPTAAIGTGSGAGQTPAPTMPGPVPRAPAAARGGADETYHMRADRLSGSATSDEDVYTAIHVTVEHGSTTATGDSARVFRKREIVFLMGNVKIIDGKTTMWGDEASYDRKARVAILRGNVRIQEGAARITGQEARFYRNENRSVIVGSPRMEDSTRTLTASQIEYNRGKDEVLALGHVVAVDRAESTTVRAGRVRYDRKLNYAWASQSPALVIDESGGKSTTVRGLTMEFDNARRAVFALGDVLVERDKLRAKGDRGEFYGNENRALLVGHPRAWDEEGEVQGDTLEIRFVQHRVESVQVRPHATVRYQAKADSGRGERNEAVGDTVTLFNPDQETRRAVVVGHAR